MMPPDDIRSRFPANSMVIGLRCASPDNHGVDLQIYNANPPQATIGTENSPVTPAVVPIKGRPRKYRRPHNDVK